MAILNIVAAGRARRVGRDLGTARGGSARAGAPAGMTLDALAAEARRSMGAALSSLGLGAPDYGVEPSARPGFGDVSSNAAFLLARQAGRPPAAIASDIARACPAGRLIERVEAHASGHVNFFADAAALARETVTSALRKGYCTADVGRGRRATVEHTSVNPNKALHIGHMRNVALGDAVARMLAATGHDVSTLNYVDDSGLQVANLMIGFDELGFAESPGAGQKFDAYCGDTVYVGAMERIEADEGLRRRASEVLARIERGGTEEARRAERLTRRILDAQLETCWRVGARYDCLNFESHILRSGMWEGIFARLRESGAVRLEAAGKNAGCWTVPGEDGEDDKVLVRSGGTATYMAKDIPYAAWKLGLVEDPFGYEPHATAQPGRELACTTLGGPAGGASRFASPRVITVIDSRQSRLQGIISSLLRRFFGVGEGAYVHLAYESVTLSAETARGLGLETGGRAAQMSGRRGLYVGADSVLDSLAARAMEETSRRNGGAPEAELRRVAEQIAVGALRYEMVRQDLDRAVTFDLARSLSLEGDTAAYLQYAHARAVRVLERAGGGHGDADYGALGGPHERALVMAIGSFGPALRGAASSLSPKTLARYAHGLAVGFNSFYEHVRVTDGEGGDGATAARVALVAAFRATIEGTAGILGIPMPGRM